MPAELDLPPWAAAWIAFVAGAVTVTLWALWALLERSGPIRLQHWAEEAGGELAALYAAGRRFEAFRFFLSLAAKLAPILMVWAVCALLRRQPATAAFGWSMGAVVLLLLISEWLNRSLVELHSEGALRRLTGLLRGCYRLLSPAIWLVSRYTPHTDADDTPEEVEDEASEGEIRAFIDVGRREGILEAEEEELLRSLVDFGDTRARSVMTPRVDMVCAPAEARLEELAAVFLDSKHSRLPLYRESIDHIVGILHIRDLFEALYRNGSTDAGELSKPPYFVPESKSLRQLLGELQALHQQMAIVVDEYGGVAGLLTVEDLLEEIVGDISDEHEENEPRPERQEDGSWRLEGRTDLEALVELFGVDLDEVPYETVSGLICGQLGYVPKAGEELATHDLVFTVESADERRVTSVQVRRAEPEGAGTPT